MALDLYQEAGKTPQDTSLDLYKEAGLVNTVKWPEKKEQKMPLLPRMAGEVARQAGATLETPLAFATGAALWIPSKLYGATKAPLGREAMDRAGEALAKYGYQPQTPEGRAALELIGHGIDKALWPAKRFAEGTKEKMNKAIGQLREFRQVDPGGFVGTLADPQTQDMEKARDIADYFVNFGAELAEFGLMGGGARAVKAKIASKKVPKDVKISQADIDRIAEVVPTDKEAAQARGAKTKERLKAQRAERERAKHFKQPTKSAKESAAAFERERGYPESEAQRAKLKRDLTAEGDIGRLRELKKFPGKPTLIKAKPEKPEVKGKFRLPPITVPRIQKGKEFGAKLTEGERSRLLAGEAVDLPLKAKLRKGEPKYATPVAPRKPEVSYKIKEKGKAPVYFEKGESMPWEAKGKISTKKPLETKKVEVSSPKQIGEKLGLIYNGVQEGAGGKISGHMFTDQTKGAEGSFTVRGESPTIKDVAAKTKAVRKSFKDKPTITSLEDYKKRAQKRKPTLKAAPKAKEPWEMTAEEWRKSKRLDTPADGYTIGTQKTRDQYDYSHRKVVEQALKDGKPVPAEVLKDYPELKPTEAKKVEGKAKEPLAAGFHIRDTLVDKDVFNNLSKEKQTEILKLKSEYDQLPYIDVRTELGPDQIRRMSEKQKNKIAAASSKVFGIESKVKQLLKTDKQALKESGAAELRKLEGRKLQLERRIEDIESFSKKKLESKRGNIAKTDYENTKQELNEVNKKIGKIGKGEAPTLESLGFQTMYEAYKKWRAKKGRPVTRQEEIQLQKGPVAKERIIKTKKGLPDRKAPKVYKPELDVLRNTTKLKETPLRRAMENPDRTFEAAGGEPLLEMTVRAAEAVDNAMSREIKQLNKDIKIMRKGISRKSRVRIGAYAIGQQKRGQGLLKDMGVERVQNLTKPEMKVYKDLRVRLEDLYSRIQEARGLSGKESMGRVENYFTFFRDLSTLEQLGFNPMEAVRASTINRQFLKLKTTPLRFAKARAKTGLYPLELDPFYIFERYSKSALKHIHFSPLIAKIREYAGNFKVKGKKGAEEVWKLADDNPILARSLTAWTNHIAGQKALDLPPLVEKSLYAVNRNLLAAILGASTRSALIQPSAVRGVYSIVGSKYLVGGVKGLLSPSRRRFALDKSKVLFQRDYDTHVRDLQRMIAHSRIGEAKKMAADASLKPLQLLDMETATASWLSFYDYAKAELGYSEARAYKFADGHVIKTQASGSPIHVAPIQRTAPGKTLTLFQTFTINDWNMMVKDILGVRNARLDRPTALKRTMRFIAATTIMNIVFEDLIGINSPFPTPIRTAWRSIKDKEDKLKLARRVGLELIEPVPVVGSTRYGKGVGGPALELVKEVVQLVQPEKKPFEKPILEVAGKLVGVPGTAQLSKSIRAHKRGESPYGQIVGTYTKKEKTRLVRSRRSSSRSARLKRARR